jgi:hypothetical protein
MIIAGIKIIIIIKMFPNVGCIVYNIILALYKNISFKIMIK